jgi:tRNA pseudouridine13 synthase
LRLAIATPARADRPVEKAFKHILHECWGDWGKALRKLPTLPYRRAVEVLKSSGDFRAAFTALPYFLQQINVEAYQSFLWNATASDLVRRCPKQRVWEARDVLGLTSFVAFKAVEEELRDMIIPLLSPKTKLEGPWALAAQAVLKREHIGLSDLRIPGLPRPFFGEAPRRLMVEASGFFLTRPDQDQRNRRLFQRRVEFELPRGAYATVLLAALGQ